ncbi:tRNA (guanosine(46)-N7)-methyltransferase TrmB [Helicobacter monodelphidis]|uniref:tRNA (guanosine(46)-N7)-methyltransferase TrmB n=1 Tax=Helicobacter sp. 15-1451 TaxID=2004995 RepID=UPI000DCBC74D|nr:tRNA (guanosine(46)-N7)-methyltransferase TrmB [Helicobacter sp. 15-1451]RAX58641.1 tRNA (guanosine(46)-N7)-methyltransferase TrmB [Helicobacter sp. 15-1451]
MPHILLSSVRLPKMPFEQESFQFLGQYFDENTQDSLILVQYQCKRFFLRMQQKKEGILVKCDKQSRISPVGILKNALMQIRNINADFCLRHNLSPNKPRQEEENPYFYYSVQTLLQELHDHHFESVNLEIGFGSGRRILQTAKQNPSSLWIGLEIHMPSIEQVLRQITLSQLENLRILSIDARLLLEVLPNQLLDEIVVHFPIPWKKLHRRVINDVFVAEVKRVLKPSGILNLRSDDEEYFRQSLDLFLQDSKSHIEIFKNRKIAVCSKYEERWLRQNKNIFDILYRPALVKIAQEKADFSFTKEEAQGLYKYFQGSFMPFKQCFESAFLSIQQLFSNAECKVIQLCFGSVTQPQSNYLLLFPDSAEYFNPPLNLAANRRIHQILKKYHQSFIHSTI